MSLDNPSTSRQRYLRIVDIGTCIGCGACEAACDFIHDGKPYIKVYRTSLGLEIPVSCLHCAKAPCIDVCPTGAMTRDKEGVVYVIPSKCIGCMACLYACPFGIPQLDKKLRISTKCDLCYDQRKKGLEPGCSSLCPTGAIVYSAEPIVFDIAKKKTAESWAKARYESLK